MLPIEVSVLKGSRADGSVCGCNAVFFVSGVCCEGTCSVLADDGVGGGEVVATTRVTGIGGWSGHGGPFAPYPPPPPPPPPPLPLGVGGGVLSPSPDPSSSFSGSVAFTSYEYASVEVAIIGGLKSMNEGGEFCDPPPPSSSSSSGNTSIITSWVVVPVPSKAKNIAVDVPVAVGVQLKSPEVAL